MINFIVIAHTIYVGLSVHEYRFLYLGAAVTILTAFLRMAVEMFQLCRHPLEYLLDWVNWLELPLYLFSIIIIYICICHPLSVCLQLAVANWSGSCISGMDRTNNLSPKMACDGSLCSDVREHSGLFSEDSLSGSVAGDCFCSGILHAVI